MKFFSLLNNLDARSLNLVIMGMAVLAIITIVVSLRRRAEKALANLRESEERYRLLIINSRDMIASLRPDGVFDYVSPTAHSLTGYDAKDLVGSNWYHYIHPEERELCQEKVRSVVLEGKSALTLEHRFCRKEGAYLWLETVIQPVLDLNRKILRFQNSSRDVSERKRIEQMKDDFMSTVSHELRTPLTVIKGAISNLKDGVMGALTEKQAHVVETTSRNVDRLARLIHDLLDLSRLESRKSRVNRCQVRFDELIREICHNFSTMANDRRILLDPDIPAQLPSCYADPDLMTQVLTNLVHNALRFAKEKVVMQCRVMERYLRVGVFDDGPGILLEDQKLLFSKFEQLVRPTAGAGYKGTGLGLAICKEIIDEHKGKIWVESTPGQGAKFYFSVLLDLRSQV